jgi:hypothetical protein
MTKIISISVSDADKVLIDDMELSPSGLFKQKMQEIRDNSFNYATKLNKLMEANSQLTKLLFEEQEKNKHGVV